MPHIQENPINPRCHAFEVLASFFLGESQIKLLIPSFHPFSHRFEQSHRTRWNNSFDRYPIHYSTCSFSLPMAHIGCSVHHPQSTLQLLSQTTPRARPKPATSATKKVEEEGCRGIHPLQVPLQTLHHPVFDIYGHSFYFPNPRIPPPLHHVHTLTRRHHFKKADHPQSLQDKLGSSSECWCFQQQLYPSNK